MGQYSGDERGKAKSWAQAWVTQAQPLAKVQVLRPVPVQETDNLAIHNSNVVVYLRQAEKNAEAAAAEPAAKPRTFQAPPDREAPVPQRDGLRHGAGVALAALVCINAAALLTGWTPAPSTAQASVIRGEMLVGEWRGECRSGETRQPIRMQVAKGDSGYDLRWSRFAYPLSAADDGLGWTAKRDGARIGDVALEGDTLHVRMDNFRCGWIAAQRV
jgi:hypothetical protein